MAWPVAALNGAGLGSPAVADFPGFGSSARRFRLPPPTPRRPARIVPARPASKVAVRVRRPARVESDRVESRIRAIRRASSERSEIIPTPARRQRGQPALGQLEQVAGISAPVRAECDDEIVADLLGRLLDPPRQHPEQRLHPQRRRGQLPEQVPQPVAAAQMRQFVDEGITQVLLRVLRQQDGRPAQAVQARTRQEGRTKDPREPQSHSPG